MSVRRGSKDPLLLHTPNLPLPWTAGEPPKDCILLEGVHEIVVALKAFISPG